MYITRIDYLNLGTPRSVQCTSIRITHSIDVSKCVVQYIDIGSKAYGDVERDSGITGVLTAMENIG